MSDRRDSLPLTDFALGNPFLVLLFLGMGVVSGIFSYMRLGADLFPPVTFPLVSVRVSLPGAGAGEVTRRLTEPVENALAGLPHLRHLHSTVLPGMTVVTAVFDDAMLGRSPDREVRQALSRISRALPSGATSPVVVRENPTRLPLMWVILPYPSGPPPSIRSARTLAAFVKESVLPPLLKIRGVESISVLAPPRRLVHVYLRLKSLERDRLTPSALAGQLLSAGRAVPAGRIRPAGTEMDIEAEGSPQTLDALVSFPVLLPSGKTVPLGHVATVVEGEKIPSFLFRFDGAPAIALRLYASRGSDLVALSRKVRLRMQQILASGAGSASLSHFSPVIRMDRSVPVERNNRELLETLLVGAGLAVLVIFLFLGNIRETAVAALAIPASVLGTFPLLLLARFTLNSLTMLGLSLVVGILIDDAIVVLENINRHRMMGESSGVSARTGVGEIGRAVLATTFSIVAVFAPMAMMHGVLGEFFTEFGWTVSFAVLASLLVSLTVIPILMLSRTSSETWQEPHHYFPRLRRWGQVVRERYGSLLAVAMDSAGLLGGLSVALFAGALLLATHLGWNLVPDVDQEAFSVHLRVSGSPAIDRTDAVATAISKKIQEIPGVISVFHKVGGERGANPSEGYLYVTLADRERRSWSDLEYREKARKILSGFSGVRFSVDTISPIGGTGANEPFQCFLLGPDPAVLEALARKAGAFLSGIPGFRDVGLSSAGSRASLAIRPLSRDPLNWNASPENLAGWISSMTSGRPAGRVETPEGPEDLVVALDPSAVSSQEQLGRLPFPVSSSRALPLRDVAALVLTRVPQRLNRDDRVPSVTLSANLGPELSQGEAMKRMDGWAVSHLPAGYRYRYAGNSDVLNDAKSQFSWAFLVALGVVFTVLSLQFESLVMPFVIMISIPFSVVGAVAGLWISGIPANIMSAIGVIILFGLVTKNAILLVDYANTLRRKGRSVREAAIESGRVRLRPIAMTTLAMIFGMAPMAVGWGAGGTVRESMAVVVIGGLVSSMFFTLFLVPVVYARVAGVFKIHGTREES